MGPTLPPGNLDERPATDPSEDSDADKASSSDEDDDFGPALPSADASTSNRRAGHAPQTSAGPRAPTVAESTAVRRDEWMIIPPSAGDWTSRVDPTKLKNRKFATGKAATTASDSGIESTRDAAIWHETPAEKKARLEREMMGIATNTLDPKQPGSNQKGLGETDAITRAKRDKMREHNVGFLSELPQQTRSPV